MATLAGFFGTRAVTKRLPYVVVSPATCTFLLRVSAKVLVQTQRTVQLELNGHFDVLWDANVCLSLGAHLQRAKFQSLVRNLDVSLSTGDIWLMIVLQKCLSAPIEWWFEAAPSYVDEIALYLVDRDYKALLISLRKSGIAISFFSREIKPRRGFAISLFLLGRPRDRHFYRALTSLDCFGCTIKSDRSAISLKYFFSATFVICTVAKCETHSAILSCRCGVLTKTEKLE
jgi:hypothetical protein